jgi:hypothetical protein
MPEGTRKFRRSQGESKIEVARGRPQSPSYKQGPSTLVDRYYSHDYSRKNRVPESQTARVARVLTSTHRNKQSPDVLKWNPPTGISFNHPGF